MAEENAPADRLVVEESDEVGGFQQENAIMAAGDEQDMTQYPETAYQIAFKYKRVDEEGGEVDQVGVSGYDTRHSFRVPLPAPVQELPAWQTLMEDVYTTSNRLSAPDPNYRPTIYPKAPLSNTVVYPEAALRPFSGHPKKKVPISEYTEKFLRPEKKPEAGIQPPSVNGSFQEGGDPFNRSQAALAVSADHWKTSYDTDYQYRDDLRPYSQHLLRYKTTSWLAAQEKGASIGPGNHLMRVGTRVVESGRAPREQHYALRRSDGGREMIEVMHGHTDIDNPDPLALSQCHPPRTYLLRHMIDHDNGNYAWRQSELQKGGEVPAEEEARGTTGAGSRVSTARGKLPVVPTIVQFPALKHSGMHSTYGSAFKDPFGKAVEQERALERLALSKQERDRLAEELAAVQSRYPAGCVGLDPSTLPSGTVTVPRSFRSVHGVMLEDGVVADRLKYAARNSLRPNRVPRAKRTEVDKLIAFTYQHPADNVF